MTLLQKLSRNFRAFGGDKRANVLITFALATLPLVGFTGFAVDYSHANSVKAAMQAAVDSTALMLSKEATTDTASQLQTNATKYFNALFTRPEATNVSLTATYSATGGSQIVVNGSANVPTQFLGVIGYNNIPVTASSTAKWGSSRLRVALVLDNTGSMADSGKITALITATKSLLTQLQNAATNNGDVYVSIIPFVKDVNVGSSNYSANWIDWTTWQSEPAILKNNYPSGWDQVNGGDPCPFSTYTYGFGCKSGPSQSASNTNTIPSSGSYAGYVCPSMDSGAVNPLLNSVWYNGCYNSVAATRTISSGSNASCGGNTNCSCSGSGSSKSCKQTYYNHTWISNATSTWTGCVMDRGDSTGPNSGNYDTNVVAPTTSTTATLYPAEQYDPCPQAAMGLSYNWSGMTTLVNNMSPSGGTNQNIGLQLGWMSLAGGGPFTVPAMDPNYTYTQIIILLTDGLNTEDRWYGNGSTTSTQVDARQTLTCANIKAANITIYTIQVNTDGSPTSTLLQNCASDSTKFFLLTSSSAIVTTFNTIGTNLTKLRVAK